MANIENQNLDRELPIERTENSYSHKEITALLSQTNEAVSNIVWNQED